MSKLNLKAKYQKEITEALKKEFKYNNSFAVPKIEKIVLNMGVSDPQDPRARKKVMENIVEQFRIIAGQQPQISKAKKAIAGFKLRAGDPLGVMVTLRGKKMWQFLDKLIAIALPRVKDFRGVSRTAFDGQGNYSLGLEEQIVFPEINYDKIERIRSLQVNIVSSTKKDKEALRLLELLGMPFEKEKK
ncbi:MAG: 50S ribosomal protein L5 [Candidatus Woesebacteria bacterium]|jgi:large subunit ribosomal protein L5